MRQEIHKDKNKIPNRKWLKWKATLKSPLSRPLPPLWEGWGGRGFIIAPWLITLHYNMKKWCFINAAAAFCWLKLVFDLNSCRDYSCLDKTFLWTLGIYLLTFQNACARCWQKPPGWSLVGFQFKSHQDVWAFQRSGRYQVYCQPVTEHSEDQLFCVILRDVSTFHLTAQAACYQ